MDERSRYKRSRSKRSRYKLDVGEQLLPGIPDEITINEISLRLPWKAFHKLSRVSRAWQQAIRSCQIYDARVRSKSTDALVLFNHQPSGVNRIALYSIKENQCYHLPPIPGHSQGIPWFCGCVFLDGKLYILGGSHYSTSKSKLDDGLSGDEVYVFDVVGQKHWKQCASMNERRGEFGCCAMDSKIYVFGGRKEDGPVRGAEVYDAKEDSWSPITPMPSLGFNQKVAAVGDELFVYGGDYYDPDFVWTGLGDRLFGLKHYSRHPSSRDQIHIASTAEVYHPCKDEWRIAKQFLPDSYRAAKRVVMVGGKLHKRDSLGTHVYDIHASSWTLLPRTTPSPASVRQPLNGKLRSIQPRVAVGVNDEVFTTGENREEGGGGGARFGLFKSIGFGVENNELDWQDTKCLVSYTNAVPPFMHSMQL